MKVTLVMVSSADGCITKGDNPNIYEWTSSEDQQQFFSLLKQQTLIVMGSKTFDAARSVIKPESGILRIVMTNRPEEYADFVIPRQLEFSSEKPKELIGRLSGEGFTKMLLVGGGEINAAFFKAKMVDEMIVTVEPKLFGKGKSLLGDDSLLVRLHLESFERLNEQGTVQLKYKVV